MDKTLNEKIETLKNQIPAELHGELDALGTSVRFHEARAIASVDGEDMKEARQIQEKIKDFAAKVAIPEVELIMREVGFDERSRCFALRSYQRS